VIEQKKLPKKIIAQKAKTKFAQSGHPECEAGTAAENELPLSAAVENSSRVKSRKMPEYNKGY
jgi:hypothetical protein